MRVCLLVCFSKEKAKMIWFSVYPFPALSPKPWIMKTNILSTLLES